MAAAPKRRTPVAEHIARVNSLLAPLATRPDETVKLAEALGRVTAHETVSPIALPPFRNSQMDGFAVRARDIAAAPVTLPIVGEIAAAPGHPGELADGTAVRIMTGAAIPTGADAVVPVEDTEATGDMVTILRARAISEYVREAGSDLAAGAVLLPAGLRLAPRHIAALAASNLNSVTVRSRVSVAVISTGSELVEPGAGLQPGQIPDANGAALGAAVPAAGARLVLNKRTTDSTDEFAAILDEAITGGAELLLTSGGISMGDHEVVRELLEPLGAHVDVLAMQPGGPQALATYRGVPVVCFPGNPVSSQLSFEIFVAPFLRELAGILAPLRKTMILDAAVRSIAGKRQFLRGRRTDRDHVATVGGPGSHLVAALAASDVIIEIPEDIAELAAGDSVETWEL